MHAQVPARNRNIRPAKATSCQQTHTHTAVDHRCLHAAHGNRHAGLALETALLCPKARLRTAQPETNSQTLCVTRGGARRGRHGPQNQQQKGVVRAITKATRATCAGLGSNPNPRKRLEDGAGQASATKSPVMTRGYLAPFGPHSGEWGAAQVPRPWLPTHVRARSAPVQSSAMKCQSSLIIPADTPNVGTVPVSIRKQFTSCAGFCSYNRLALVSAAASAS